MAAPCSATIVPALHFAVRSCLVIVHSLSFVRDYRQHRACMKQATVSKPATACPPAV